ATTSAPATRVSTQVLPTSAPAPCSTTSPIGRSPTRTTRAATSRRRWRRSSRRPRAGSSGISKPRPRTSGMRLRCWMLEFSRTRLRTGGLVLFAMIS
ncbi:hypothetical protein LTS18_005319, partial [Coniosporium uncinatum]